jgi:hypothetical protein
MFSISKAADLNLIGYVCIPLRQGFAALRLDIVNMEATYKSTRHGDKVSVFTR